MSGQGTAGTMHRPARKARRAPSRSACVGVEAGEDVILTAATRRAGMVLGALLIAGCTASQEGPSERAADAVGASASGTSSAAVAPVAGTTPDAHAWTMGQPAPAVAGFTLAGNNAHGYPEYDKDLAGSGIAMRFVLIPAGSFAMGSAETRPSEGPQHHVTLDAFLLARTSCTQLQWLAVMGSNPSLPRSHPAMDYPVDRLSWLDAQDFLRLEGLSLPSEAQWEYAARGGSLLSPPLSWWWPMFANDKRPRTSMPVASGTANGFGLHDMRNNVWEWCEDSWHDSFAGAPADGSAWVDATEVYKVIRGSSWVNRNKPPRYTLRGRNPATSRSSEIGFRPAFRLR